MRKAVIKRGLKAVKRRVKRPAGAVRSAAKAKRLLSGTEQEDRQSKKRPPSAGSEYRRGLSGSIWRLQAPFHFTLKLSAKPPISIYALAYPFSGSFQPLGLRPQRQDGFIRRA